MRFHNSPTLLPQTRWAVVLPWGEHSGPSPRAFLFPPIPPRRCPAWWGFGHTSTRTTTATNNPRAKTRYQCPCQTLDQFQWPTSRTNWVPPISYPHDWLANATRPCVGSSVQTQNQPPPGRTRRRRGEIRWNCWNCWKGHCRFATRWLLENNWGNKHLCPPTRLRRNRLRTWSGAHRVLNVPSTPRSCTPHTMNLPPIAHVP